MEDNKIIPLQEVTEDYTESPTLGQAPADSGGYLSRQLQPAIEGAAAQIRAGLDKQRTGFWAGFIAGTVTVLAMKYIMQREL